MTLGRIVLERAARFRLPLLIAGMGIAGLAAALPCGCIGPQRPQVGQLPERFELETGQCLVRSDVKLAADDPIVGELKSVRQKVAQTLSLPPYQRPVVVYLFRDENRYAQYMSTVHPSLPPRRAFFIGGPSELAVYAFWSTRVQEDLRHEYTHGLLHSALPVVPLWLDEGLAEYFETGDGGPDGLHPDHARGLAVAVENGWRPDLQRLEQLEEVAEMQRADYQESWAWVHYLLHDNPDGRALLTDYLQSLRETKNRQSPVPSLAALVKADTPDAELRLVSHITGLRTDHHPGRVSLNRNDSF